MKTAGLYPFAKALAETCQLLYRNGLSPARAGNVSARDHDLVWITPAGSCLGEVTPADLVLIWPDGRICAEDGRKPSSEWPMHRAIYERCPHAGAVVHSHPPQATAMAAAHQPLDRHIVSEIAGSLGDIPLVPYHPPGSQDLADAVADTLARGHLAVLMANHGVLAIGNTLADACYHLELVESFARIFWLARGLGELKELSPEQVARIRRDMH